MKILKLFICFLLTLVVHNAYAADTVKFKIVIADPAYFPTVVQQDIGVSVSFADGSLNDIIGTYSIYTFRHEFASVQPFLQQYYVVEASSGQLMTDLMNYNSNVFQSGHEVPQAKLLAWPDDYGKDWSGNQGELDLIGARAAWSVDTGDLDMIIGLEDQSQDTMNVDLVRKVVKFDNAWTQYNQVAGHATAVTGIMAARTNNNKIMAGMCPGCRIDFSSEIGNYAKMDSMSLHGRRVINASWHDYCVNPTTWYNDISYQANFDEMYENGTSFVAAAGNGKEVYSNGVCYGTDFDYNWPASYNHNLSIGGIGYDVTGGATQNIADVIEKIPGDTTSGLTHNDKVTICAPSYNMHVLANGATGSTIMSGSSLSSPLAAGTAALMLHTKPQLSPYQVECILRKTADSNCRIDPANARYAGKMGAGRLRAGVALQWAADNSQFNVADPRYATMVIQGIEINTICAPTTFPRTLYPKMTPVITGGTPPYTYKWYALPGNKAYLDNDAIDSPTILGVSAPYLANYYLVVKDNSEVQKVASRHIQIQLDTANTWNLAMRDSYLDMMGEPNQQAVVDPREWHIWESPDLWNRVANDGILTQEDPQYTSASNDNYMYARVRNVGCASAPAGAKLKLYWTKASTGEKWKGDWDTATFNGFVAGKELTGTGITIGAIAAGADTVIAQSWIPPRPQNYDPNLTSVEVCFLGRIEDGHNAADVTGGGMTFPEVSNVSTNVRNNNNIVTRNTFVWNLSGYLRSYHQVGIGNTGTASQTFNFAIATGKHYHAHYSGDIRQLVSSMTLTLSAAVYSSWVANGAQGNYSSIDEIKHSVTFSNPSDYMQLNGITLDAGQKDAINIEIATPASADSVIIAPIPLYIIQQAEGSSEIYGNVTVELRNTPIPGLGMRKAGNEATAQLTASQFNLYPNPTSGSFTLFATNNVGSASVMVTDLTGKVILNTNHDFSNVQKMKINLSLVAPGIYMVKVTTPDQLTKVFKLVKE